MKPFTLIPVLLMLAVLLGPLAGCSEEQQVTKVQGQTVVVPEPDGETNKRAADRHVKHDQDSLQPNDHSARSEPDGTTEPVTMDDTAWDSPEFRLYNDSSRKVVETRSRWATSDQEKWFESQVVIRYLCTDERWDPAFNVNYLSPADTENSGYDGTWRKFSLLMKVDDRKPQALRGEYFPGSRGFWMEDYYDSAFLDAIREGKRLAIRISYNTDGENIFRWDLAGLNDILDSIPAMCPAGS